MGILDNVLGPQSKYDKMLPYTYEARMPIIEGDAEYNSYLSDTICGLVKYLTENSIDSQEVEIYEIFADKEKLIPKQLYTLETGAWMSQKGMCQSFKDHYEGYIYEDGCVFEDRNCKGVGP